jgi:hypothetical protein
MFTFEIVYLGLNVMEIIYLTIPVVYSIILQMNNPVQNTAHIYYFNVVNARSTAKLSIAIQIHIKGSRNATLCF